MCWNCGCMMPDDTMGNPNNITTETIRKAGKAGGTRTVKDTFKNMMATYEAKVKGTSADNAPIK